MRQPPDGLQAGALKPPLPLGMPAGRTAPAEINRLTVSLQQVGHLGSGSLAERCKYSNSHSQDSHRYSKIGIALLPGYGAECTRPSLMVARSMVLALCPISWNYFKATGCIVNRLLRWGMTLRKLCEYENDQEQDRTATQEDDHGRFSPPSGCSAICSNPLVGPNGAQCVPVVGFDAIAVGQFDMPYSISKRRRHPEYIAAQESVKRIGEMPDVQHHTVKLDQNGLGLLFCIFIVCALKLYQ
jgi:hypothetical protein